VQKMNMQAGKKQMDANAKETEMMTGAEIVLRALQGSGCGAHIRLSGRRGAADL
jgi:hypothetical protein